MNSPAAEKELLTKGHSPSNISLGAMRVKVTRPTERKEFVRFDSSPPKFIDFFSKLWRLGGYGNDIVTQKKKTRPSDTKIYSFHVENLRAINNAADQVAQLARHAIATENDATTQSLVLLYAFLLGAWAECRLKKLLYESSGFTPKERDQITHTDAQIDQWHSTVEIAFRKHYSIPTGDMKALATNAHSAYARYLELGQLLDTDLRSAIEIRNKLAHGQWIYPFNNECTDIESDKFKALKNENLQSLIFKFSLISELAEIIHDLVVSNPTFSRDFDKHYRVLSQARINLRNRPYEKYKERLIQSYKNGKSQRAPQVQSQVAPPCNYCKVFKHFADASMLSYIRSAIAKLYASKPISFLQRTLFGYRFGR